MKKRMIQLGLCLLVGGIILTGLGYLNGGHNQIFLGNNGRISLAESRESVLYVDEPLVFSSIDIETDVMDIEILPAAKFSIDAKYNLINPIEYSVKDGVLTVIAKRPAGTLNVGMTFGEENRIVISVPEGLTLDQLTVRGRVGDTSIGALTAKKARLNGNVGNILINGLTADAVEATTTTGDIRIQDADIEKCAITSNVGDIYMRPVGIRSDYALHFSTNIGSARVIGETGNAKNDGHRQIDASSNVGDITVEFTGQ